MFIALRFFVSMVVFHLPLILLTIFARWIAFKKYHTKDLCVTCSGLTPMIAVDGAFLPVEPDTLSVRMSQRPLTTTTE